MPSIGDRLKSERQRLGLSQEKLANIGGIRTNAQRNYELGVRSPRAHYLARIDAVGIDTLYVLTCRRSEAVEASEKSVDHLSPSLPKRVAGRQSAVNETGHFATISAPTGGIAMPSDPLRKV